MFCLKEINFKIPQSIMSKALCLAHDRYIDNIGSVIDKPDIRDSFWPKVSGILGRNPGMTDLKKLEEILGEKATPIIERIFQSYHRWGSDHACFREYNIPPILEKAVSSVLPTYVADLKPNIAIQVTADHGVIPPHIDHNRETTILIMLETNGETTRWWKKIAEFEEFDNLRYPDLDSIEEIYHYVLEPNKSYIFNNSIYHSVHPGPHKKNKTRSALAIEFDGISAEELYELYLSNSQSL